MVVFTPDERASPSQGIIRQLFDLTSAEAKVASKLIQNSGNYRIAANSLGVSLETIRTQAKSVLCKAGVESMPGLIRIVSNLRIPDER